MPSSFFGLHVAATGLNAAQASINTTANNISNVNTTGYSRQEVGRKASAAQRAFTSYGCIGTGVEITDVTQVRDLYYDEKYWNNNSKLGMFQKKLYYMNQIENYYTDNAKISGFTTLYGKMFNSLDSVKKNAGDASVRNEFISNAQEMMDYFNSTAISMQDLQSSINDEIKTSVDSINSASQKIALLNKQINIIEMEGGYANELRDERARILDELSNIIPIEATDIKVSNSNYEDQYTGVTRFEVRFNGVLLVDNYEYNTLSVVTREYKANQSDIDGLFDKNPKLLACSPLCGINNSIIFDKLFLCITIFGEIWLPTLICSLVYWCIDFKAGIYLLSLEGINIIFAHFFKSIRLISS